MFDESPRLIRTISLVFKIIGAIAIAGGIVMAFDDPGALVLVAFGAVFVGAGWGIAKVFQPPEGKKAVTITDDARTGPRADGLHGQMQRDAVIYVDENATPEEAETANADWRRDRFAERPDWVAGRILPEGERSGGLHFVAAVAWSIFAILASVAALIWGGLAWFVAAGSIGLAAVLTGSYAFRRLRQRKFGSAVLVADLPFTLGEAINGQIETKIEAGQAPEGGFTLRLHCHRRWEESTDLGVSNHPTEKRLRVETIWEETRQVQPQTGSDGTLSVPVAFDLPADQPPTSLTGTNFGIFWDLEVSAEMTGLDFKNRFRVPVLEAGAVPASG